MEIGYKNENPCCFCNEVMGDEGGLHSGNPSCWRGMPPNSHSHIHCYIHHWMDSYMMGDDIIRLTKEVHELRNEIASLKANMKILHLNQQGKFHLGIFKVD